MKSFLSSCEEELKVKMATGSEGAMNFEITLTHFTNIKVYLWFFCFSLPLQCSWLIKWLFLYFHLLFTRSCLTLKWRWFSIHKGKKADQECFLMFSFAQTIFYFLANLRRQSKFFKCVASSTKLFKSMLQIFDSSWSWSSSVVAKDNFKDQLNFRIWKWYRA